MHPILFIATFSIVTAFMPEISCKAEDLFLRSDGGFQVYVESDWTIDPLEAYKQATESLRNKLKIHGMSYKNIAQTAALNEDLTVKDRAYGRVYRMQLSGFVSDEDMVKARSRANAEIDRNRIRILSSICVSLVFASFFVFAFVKVDRLLNGEKRIVVGVFCAVWFIFVNVFAISTIWLRFIN